MLNKINIGNIPTKIEYSQYLSKKYNLNFYLKRDDQTGIGLSGNKIRKLEYLFHDAIKKGYKNVITCGGIQSNHCRATAVLSRMVGIAPYLVLRGTEPEEYYDGNLFLNKLLDAQIFWVTPEEYKEQINEILQQKADAIGSCYLIPEGGSNEIGYLGYLNAGLEILNQEKEMGVSFDYIFCAVGSGGTLGGLILAKKIFNINAKIVGVNVCDDASYFQSRILRVLNSFIDKYNLELEITKDDIQIIDGFVGPGYAISTMEERQLIKEMAKNSGIFLDPVYTGKLMWALDSNLKKHEYKKSNVLFIHTGGIFGLFPQKELFF